MEGPSILDVQVTETICDVIRRHALATPDAPALLAEGKEPLTYRGLADLINDVRAKLNAMGFGRNDRIALIGPNDASLAALCTAVWGSATALPLNPALTLGEFAIYLRDLKAQAVAVLADTETPARDAAREIGLPLIEVERIEGPVAGLIDIRCDAPPGPAARPGPAGIDDLALVLITSGTTSHSKIVPMSHRNFINKVGITTADMGLTRDDRCLNLMPLFHAGGLHGSLGGIWLSGGSVVTLPDFSAERFFRAIETLSPTWYTGSATFQHAIAAAAADHAAALEKSRIRFIRVGAGPIGGELRGEIEEIFDAPVVGAYASTEIGQISILPLPPAPRKPGTVGRPASGMRVAVMSTDRQLLGPNQRGEVVVDAAGIFDGYENDEDANRESFVDSWFRTGDEGMLDEDGYLTLTGRIKDIINRGGEKITPKEVDDALTAHPDVAEAATFPVPHATLGQEVAAAVVPELGAALTEEMLARHLQGRLAAFKIPRRFVITGGIPKDVNGKIQRRGLAECFGLAATGPAPRREPAEDRPATPLEATLKRLWAETLGLDRVGLDDDFFLLGGDSLQAVDLFLRVEKEIGRRLPRSVLFEAGTVAKMAQRIDAFVPSSCLVPIQPEGEGLPFFCIHDRNGEVLNYRDLARLMGEEQPFYGIQARGLDGEDPPFANIEDMAAHYIQEIKRVQPEGPYLIGGYSMGGHVAYVMAQQLRAGGEEVALLALLDTYSSVGRRRAGLGDWIAHHRTRLEGMPATGLPGYLGLRVKNLGEMLGMGLFVKSFALAWRTFESLGRPVPRFLRRPVLANHMILRDYRPRPYDGEVTLFRAERYAWSHADQHEGWKNLVSGELIITDLPGQHYQIVKPPHVKALAEGLSGAIARAQPRSPACRERAPQLSP